MKYQNIFSIGLFSLLLFSFNFATAQSENDEERILEEYGPLIQIIGVLGGSISIPIIFWRLESRKQKRDKVWELYAKFHSNDFISTRNKVWDEVRKQWPSHKYDKDKTLGTLIVETFLTREIPPPVQDVKIYPDFINDVNNLQKVLDFWTEIYINITENSVDKKLFGKVFSHIYIWHRNFLKTFYDSYKPMSKQSNNPNNMWVSSIENLDCEFSKILKKSKFHNHKKYQEKIPDCKNLSKSA